MFNKDGMNAIARLLNHISTCPQVEKDFINLLAYGVVRYMGKIDKALTEILHTINEWCAQFSVQAIQVKEKIMIEMNGS